MPIVLCFGADGHIAFEAPHAVAPTDQVGVAANPNGPCGPCVDFTVHISNQKQETLYPALAAPVDPVPPAVAIVAVAALWPAAEPAQAPRSLIGDISPHLDSLRSIVLLT